MAEEKKVVEEINIGTKETEVSNSGITIEIVDHTEDKKENVFQKIGRKGKEFYKKHEKPIKIVGGVALFATGVGITLGVNKFKEALLEEEQEDNEIFIDGCEYNVIDAPEETETEETSDNNVEVVNF